MAETSLLCFPLAGRRVAVRLEDASFLVELEEIVPVPRAPRAVVGVMDVRGRIVTLLRPWWLTSDAEDSDPPPRRALILAPPRAHLGLLVPEEVQLLHADLDTASDTGGEGGSPRPSRTLVTRDGLIIELLLPGNLVAACPARHHRALRRTG